MFKKCKSKFALNLSQVLGVKVTAVSWVLLLSGCEQLPVNISKNGKQSFEQKADTNLDEFTPIVDANMPAPTQTLACDDIKDNQVITVTGHLALTPSCSLQGKNVRFILDTSNTSLDCQGAKLSLSEGNASNKSAITIKPKTDTAISNIQVANCHVEGYGHALHIRQKTNPNTRYAKRDATPAAIDPDANRARAPQHVKITNVSSIGSKNSGIFVGDHVHHVSFDQLTVARSGTVGLYFEFGSQHNSVTNSVFVDNGFRPFKPNREAIAIDSSSFNTIKNNQFIHNGAGGVHLYRNCFEHADDPSRTNHFKRTESAANNIIKNNKFFDEPVGVWVASRQSRNLKGFECGAYVLAQTPFASYHLDSAKNNRIIGNTFVNVDTGIIVEDDGTHIIGNDFRRIAGVPYKVGSKIRGKYAGDKHGIMPNVQGTVIKDNQTR